MFKKIFSKRAIVIAASGIGFAALGILGTLGYQYAFPHGHDDHKVHYHANFLVYLDNQFVNFDGSEYMEELASCAVDPNKERPQDRVHLHENKGSLIHVHDAGATWGHLMSNIGWNFGDAYLVDGARNIHVADGKKQMRFVLNGKLVKNLQNRQIQSVDRLLIDFSDATDAEVLKRFESVPKTADEQNHLPDPAACGGQSE